MDRATVNGVELEYEVKGAGEPLLLIGNVLADACLPFMSERALTDRYRLIRYHKRGWSGSTHTPPPVTMADHAADAAALLEHLGVECAHVAGHSSGGVVALELAVDRPELVRSLVLLEPALLWVPGAQAFFAKLGPAIELYRAGEREAAVMTFLGVVSGLEPAACRAVIDEHAPGAVASAIRDADTLFGIELPAVGQWRLPLEQAAGIYQPVLSVIGRRTDPVFVEGADLLRASIPDLEQKTLEDVGHLLQLERPGKVARCIREFLARQTLRSREVTQEARHSTPSVI